MILLTWYHPAFIGFYCILFPHSGQKRGTAPSGFQLQAEQAAAGLPPPHSWQKRPVFAAPHWQFNE